MLADIEFLSIPPPTPPQLYGEPKEPVGPDTPNILRTLSHVLKLIVINPDVDAVHVNPSMQSAHSGVLDGVTVFVGVGVDVDVAVGVKNGVKVGVFVAVTLGVGVAVDVAVGVKNGVKVGVAVGLKDGVIKELKFKI